MKTLKMDTEKKDFNMVDLTFQLNVSKNQKANGILGKVIIYHPAFSTRATLFQTNNGIRVQGPSIRNKGEWFNIVSLKEEFRDYIVSEYQKEIAGERDATPWYLKLQGKEKTISSEMFNETLDIEKINIFGNMTESQIKSNMVASVTIDTSIAIVKNISIYKSKFSKQLYAVGRNEDDELRIPAYTLSKETEAQILSIIHPLVLDWGIEEKAFDKELFNAELYNE